MNLTPQQLRQAADVQEQIDGLRAQLERLLAADQTSRAPAPPPVIAGGPKKRKLSPQAIANIRAGVKKRMAKQAGKRQTSAPAKQPKKKISAAGKAKLSALAKARWAKAKAAGKSRL